MSRSGSGKVKQVTNGQAKKKEELPPGDAEEEDEDDGPIRAPIQLKIEFVNSIMFRQWPLAKKLCQFMLMYEPDNSEAKQYAPLIEYMLNHQQDSSSSSDDSSDDDDDDDSSGSSSSSSSNEDEEKPNDTVEPQAPKPVNASLAHKCPYHK